MRLYIRFGNLHKFNLLYKGSELLQTVLKGETGIMWNFDNEYKNEINGLLESRGINFDIE